MGIYKVVQSTNAGSRVPCGVPRLQRWRAARRKESSTSIPSLGQHLAGKLSIGQAIVHCRSTKDHACPRWYHNRPKPVIYGGAHSIAQFFIASATVSPRRVPFLPSSECGHTLVGYRRAAASRMTRRQTAHSRNAALNQYLAILKSPLSFDRSQALFCAISVNR